MIIVFHYFTNFVYKIYAKYIKQQNSTQIQFTITKLGTENHPLALPHEEDTLKFDPPLYKQRYERVLDIINDDHWKNDVNKVVDFGCAEFGLFVFLKNSINASNITFVDIDEGLLRDSLFKLYPLNGDYLKPRSDPLTLQVYQGSLAHPDSCLEKTDVVVGIEVIEHLYPDVLEALPYNVFSFIRPKLAIFTTPNSEFNVYFPKLNESKKFRHIDHKFEWTREQFETWASNLTLRFPCYTVQFDGIGFGLSGAEPEGCCSQLAVFIRKDVICDNFTDEKLPCLCANNTRCSALQICSCVCNDCVPRKSFEDRGGDADKNNYKLIKKIEYPIYIDTRTEEEKLIDELNYRIHAVSGPYGTFWNDDLNRSEIPLLTLTSRNFGNITISEMELRNLLSKLNFKIEKCFNQESNQLENSLIYDFEMASSDENDASGYESDKCNLSLTTDDPVSDWDEQDSPPKFTQDKIEEGGPKSSLNLEVVSTSKKPNGALFDSGYQKSPSAPDESPSGPPLLPLTTDIKSQTHEKPTKLSNILSVFQDFDKINELDVRRDRRFFNYSTNLPHKEVMKKICEEIAKNPVAGPSRELKKKSPKKSQSSDSDDSADEVKSIATCLLENTLNKIEDDEDHADVIRELIEVEEQQQPVDQVVPVQIVENGDLANNNRDLEGNNYPPDPQPVNEENLIDNLEVNNVNIDNNNEVVHEVDAPVPNPEQAVQAGEAAAAPEDVFEDAEVAWSSREALFDANSEVDLLEDFDMDAGAGAAAEVAANGIVFPHSLLVIPVNTGGGGGVHPPEENGFPNWLLQIFEENEPVSVDEDDLHDEPHFYCQGDGLGVHPSTVDIDDEGDDDDDDDGNESDSESSSSSTSTTEYVNAENLLPEDLSTHVSSREGIDLNVLGQALPNPEGEVLVANNGVNAGEDSDDVLSHSL